MQMTFSFIFPLFVELHVRIQQFSKIFLTFKIVKFLVMIPTPIPIVIRPIQAFRAMIMEKLNHIKEIIF